MKIALISTTPFLSDLLTMFTDLIKYLLVRKVVFVVNFLFFSVEMR